MAYCSIAPPFHPARSPGMSAPIKLENSFKRYASSISGDGGGARGAVSCTFSAHSAASRGVGLVSTSRVSVSPESCRDGALSHQLFFLCVSNWCRVRRVTRDNRRERPVRRCACRARRRVTSQFSHFVDTQSAARCLPGALRPGEGRHCPPFCMVCWHKCNGGSFTLCSSSGSSWAGFFDGSDLSEVDRLPCARGIVYAVRLAHHRERDGRGVGGFRSDGGARRH